MASVVLVVHPTLMLLCLSALNVALSIYIYIYIYLTLMQQKINSAVNAGFFLTLGITCRHMISTADGS